MDKKEIGKNIKLIRQKKNITREELAQKLNVSYSSIEKHEQGLRGFRIETINKFAEALEVPVNELLKLPSGKSFAKIENKKNEEINLLYNLLKIRYGEENININYTLDDEFIELTIGDKNIVYTKEDFEKFIDHIVNLFPTFKMILDNSKK